MPSPKNRLPVLGETGELLYYEPLARVNHLIATGLVRPVGTRNRVRALVALGGMGEMLRAERPPAGVRFSDTRETADNPRGVWRHNSRAFSYGI